MYQAKFLDFKIQNMVGSCDVKFPIRLEGLVLSHGQFSRYAAARVPAICHCAFNFRFTYIVDAVYYLQTCSNWLPDFIWLFVF